MSSRMKSGARMRLDRCPTRCAALIARITSRQLAVIAIARRRGERADRLIGRSAMPDDEAGKDRFSHV
jgi:hypothetical protein